ncbi:MAG: HAD family hydrolase [Proteobacteria bacterium]|nr:HAD family hydrolase [Pseudomonadota bacterium]
MRFDLVIFDMDGVLVDSEPIANRVLHGHFAALGVPMTLDEATRRFTGLSLANCCDHVARTHGIAIPDEFAQRVWADTEAAYLEELKPVPGVGFALDRIALPKCVASSSGPNRIALSLRLAGLEGRFGDKLFSTMMVPRGKPHPDIFLYAAARMGAMPPRTAVVEDSIYGVRGAIAAGMAVFAYAAAPHSDRAALADAGATIFTDMQELPRLLGVSVADT